MSAREPRKAESKPASKKLRLSKETVKDLTDAKGSVKGGRAAACAETTRGLFGTCH